MPRFQSGHSSDLLHHPYRPHRNTSGKQTGKHEVYLEHDPRLGDEQPHKHEDPSTHHAQQQQQHHHHHHPSMLIYVSPVDGHDCSAVEYGRIAGREHEDLNDIANVFQRRLDAEKPCRFMAKYEHWVDEFLEWQTQDENHNRLLAEREKMTVGATTTRGKLELQRWLDRNGASVSATRDSAIKIALHIKRGGFWSIYRAAEECQKCGDFL